jgi:hypothetical protein
MAKYDYCGVMIDDTLHPLWRDMLYIQKGGRFKLNGRMVGGGLFFHYKAAASWLWPHIVWHEWNELILREWLEHKYVGIMGPTNSGKTASAAWMHLLSYYCFKDNTTILICSTTRDRLEDRIWGEMKKLHKMARQKVEWIPGNLIEGKQRIVTDDRDDAIEGRDFRNGIIGVPCKKGDKFVGLGDFIGIKNEILMLCGDEVQLLPKAFIDSLPNLMKGQQRKITAMGNPAETIDSLGIICEPAAHLGGWDGGIDQTPHTKTWETRWPGGICIQLCGSDSPNMKAPTNKPAPYPFLITRENMEQDAQTWGVDDWHYTMFNEARMPRGQGSRRVITRQMCLKFGAKDDPLWSPSKRTWIAFLDAAYRGVGGDRCVFGFLEFGEELIIGNVLAGVMLNSLISQKVPDRDKRMILHLVETHVIPIEVNCGELAEDQIVKFVMDRCQDRMVPPSNFFFDSGMRTSLVQRFSQLWSVDVQSIDCGGKPSDRKVSHEIDVKCCDYYSKKITELWYSVRLIIEARQFRGMTEDVMNEGCAREWKMVGNNKIEVESKEEMKKKTGRSPDLFDALAIGVEGARQKGFMIRRLGKLSEIEQDHRWKRKLLEDAARARASKELNYAC